jgi:hypothetical protein
MKRNKLTYASLVSLICAVALLWVSLVPNQVFAAEKSTAINTLDAAKASPLPPDWKVKNFRTGKSDITNNIAEQLEPVLDYYKGNPHDLLIIQPWVSDLKYSSNNYQRQRELAQNRGISIREWLVSQGVPRDHVVILFMYGISIEPGNNFGNQQVTIWHATHPELKNAGAQAQIITAEPTVCEAQKPCPVPKVTEVKDPFITVNIPECATKTIDKKKDADGNLIVTINVNVDKCSVEIIKEVNRGNWCQAHKVSCATIIIGGVLVIGGILAIACAKGAEGPNGKGGDAGVCF